MKKTLLALALLCLLTAPCFALHPAIWQGTTNKAMVMTQTRYPTADGSGSIQFTKSTGSTNYENVADYAAADDAAYNYRQNSNGSDRFTFTAFDIPATATNISLTVYIRGKRTAAGASQLQASIQCGGSYYQGVAASDIGTSWQTVSYTYTVNPKTTAAWVYTDINGTGTNPLTRIGYTDGNLTTGRELDVTLVYAVVSYTP